MDRACARCHGGLLDERAPNPHLDLGLRLVVRPQVVAPHHARQIPSEVGLCADCHQDHQGDKGLVGVTEDQCLRCHSDLRTVDGRHTFYPKITVFKGTVREFAKTYTGPPFSVISLDYCGPYASGKVVPLALPERIPRFVSV